MDQCVCVFEIDPDRETTDDTFPFLFIWFFWLLWLILFNMRPRASGLESVAGSSSDKSA